MTIRVIDLETTGVDPIEDEIIEIASVDVRRDHTIENLRETLVRPMKSIPPEASAVHHLVDRDVHQAPHINEAIKPFKGATAYVAHNARFEQGFLAPHMPNATWICTYKCALRIFPEAPGHSNQVLRYWLGYVEPFGWSRDKIAPHRALSDVVVTAAIFLELAKAASWEQLKTWSAEPALLTRMTFGEHRGKAFSDVPADYLEWMLGTDMDEDRKFSARYWLDKRRVSA